MRQDTSPIMLRIWVSEVLKTRSFGSSVLTGITNPEERLDTGKAPWDKASENYQLPVMVTKEFPLAVVQ